ncbi:AAA family ATPase (plasmid) [Lactiplantibacillus plantarum]|nr:AAA family ATPase [Lactiplantibacillus plantarum]
MSFNTGGDADTLVKDILSKKWTNLNYILKYDNDDFSQMSQGKKAFVILTLILEFSQDKKPVIIDQPEDSLDNRSIYQDLTRYLKSKKKERQIILVTHNPNVVVGSDAENVIVANQNSSKTPNKNNVQFSYINGPLENTFLNPNSERLLESKGIREHVIEILEGGKEAFKERENKYTSEFSSSI